MNSPRNGLRMLVACMTGGIAVSATACSVEALAISSTMSSAASRVLLASISSGSIRTVTTCADGGAGSLRDQIGASASGDTIDLSGLPGADAACTNSTITLTAGAIPITHNLTLLGPKEATLTIAPTTFQRIFLDTSTDAPTPYLQISYLTIRDGVNSSGGCISAAGVEVRLNRATVTNCQTAASAPGRGAAINAQSVVMTNGSAVTNNRGNICSLPCSGSVRGGGIYASTFSCTDSTISGNYSANSGGGAFIRGSISINRCTIESNSLPTAGGSYVFHTGFGGGLAAFGIVPNSVVSISQSTIANNTAASGANYGGAVALYTNFSFTSVTIANSTISGNSSGVTISHGTGVSIDSSIIAGNGSSDLNVHSETIDLAGAHNLINNLSFTPSSDFNSAAGDPKFWPIANHGGLTRTLALQDTSPAIGMGSNLISAATDQRGPGFLREVPVGAPDIGAFELQVKDDEVFGSGF